MRAGDDLASGTTDGPPGRDDLVRMSLCAVSSNRHAAAMSPRSGTSPGSAESVSGQHPLTPGRLARPAPSPFRTTVLGNESEADDRRPGEARVRRQVRQLPKPQGGSSATGPKRTGCRKMRRSRRSSRRTLVLSPTTDLKFHHAFRKFSPALQAVAGGRRQDKGL